MLFRFLQGWDHTDADLKWNVPVKNATSKNAQSQGSNSRTNGNGNSTNGNDDAQQLQQRKIPHSTILPGLQFSLAGIIGKPETFYQVPVIRFVFEIFGHL